MPLVKLLGERLIAAGQKVSTKDALNGASAVGLYFSAGWCPPCRGFTPQLVSSYTNHLEAKGMRCVFVSWDRSVGDFEGYFAKMPWLALPYEDDALRDALNKQFRVQSIPTLALVNPNTGSVITTEARESLMRDPEGHDFPWPPPLVRDLALGNPGRINEQTSLLCLCEAAGEAGHNEAVAGLTVVAQDPEANVGLFVGSTGSLAEQVRGLCGLPVGGEPQLVLLDIPDNGGYYLGPSGHEALTEGAMRQFLADFKAGQLQRRQLSPPK